MNLAAELDWYLAAVLRLAPRTGNEVPAPQGPDPIPSNHLRDALTDPSVLFTAPKMATTPQHRMVRLMRFALWLEDPANGGVPAELASRAARYRFLVWSLPARLPAEHEDELCPRTVPWPSAAGGRAVTSDEDLRARARAAREDWLAFLAAAEDDAWLAALQTRGDALVERDLRWLTRAWPRRRPGQRRADAPRRPSHRLELSAIAASKNVRRSEHRRVAADVAETHWLPRGSILQAAAAFGWRPPLLVAALAAFPLVSAALAALLLTDHAEAARWGAVAALGAAGLVVAGGLPARADVVALLRIPAAAAAGQALLLSLTPRWWLSSNGWAIGVAMLAAVTCYIVIEARLHGTGRLPAAGRALLIAGIGAAYAFVLSLAFLGFVVPAMGEQGRCLERWWTADPLAPLPLDAYCRDQLGQDLAAWPAGVLLLMTGWSFAVGVAAQILWDDRPLTSPLGRLRRVRGTRP